jgi:hypothetical protein
MHFALARAVLMIVRRVAGTGVAAESLIYLRPDALQALERRRFTL